MRVRNYAKMSAAVAATTIMIGVSIDECECAAAFGPVDDETVVDPVFPMGTLLIAAADDPAVGVMESDPDEMPIDEDGDRRTVFVDVPLIQIVRSRLRDKPPDSPDE